MNLKRWTWIGSLAVVLGAAGAILLRSEQGRFALAMIGFPDRNEWMQRTAFDSQAWQDTNRVQREHIRIRMIDDLLAKHPLNGLTRSEVVALLGEPKPTSYFREYDLVYWLGPERSLFSVDSEWLCVRLDTNSKVSAAQVLRD